MTVLQFNQQDDDDDDDDDDEIRSRFGWRCPARAVLCRAHSLQRLAMSIPTASEQERALDRVPDVLFKIKGQKFRLQLQHSGLDIPARAKLHFHIPCELEIIPKEVAESEERHHDGPVSRRPTKKMKMIEHDGPGASSGSQPPPDQETPLLPVEHTHEVAPTVTDSVNDPPAWRRASSQDWLGMIAGGIGLLDESLQDSART